MTTRGSKTDLFPSFLPSLLPSSNSCSNRRKKTHSPLKRNFSWLPPETFSSPPPPLSINPDGSSGVKTHAYVLMCQCVKSPRRLRTSQAVLLAEVTCVWNIFIISGFLQRSQSRRSSLRFWQPRGGQRPPRTCVLTDKLRKYRTRREIFGQNTLV